MKPIDMGGRKQFFTERDFEGNSGKGRFVILCGSRPRLSSLAERLIDSEVRNHPRGFDLILGKYVPAAGQQCDVALICTGIGAPSFDAIFHHLVRAGARQFIRLGTCGSMQPQILRTGSVVIAEAAFRDEGASKNYIHAAFPAVANLSLLLTAKSAAKRSAFRGQIHNGMVHTKDSLFAREFHLSVLASNDLLMQELRSAGIIATDMETSHFYILSSLLSYQTTDKFSNQEGAIRSLAILAVVGDDAPFSSDTAAIELAEGRAADLCFEVIVESLREQENEGVANGAS